MNNTISTTPIISGSIICYCTHMHITIHVHTYIITNQSTITWWVTTLLCWCVANDKIMCMSKSIIENMLITDTPQITQNHKLENRAKQGKTGHFLTYCFSIIWRPVPGTLFPEYAFYALFALLRFTRITSLSHIMVLCGDSRDPVPITRYLDTRQNRCHQNHP